MNQPYTNPTTLDGPTHLRKKLRDQIKDEMAFERYPARCSTCRWFKSPEPNVAPFCRFGHFAVLPSSVCDRWQAMDGTVLLKREGQTNA